MIDLMTGCFVSTLSVNDHNRLYFTYSATKSTLNKSSEHKTIKYRCFKHFNESNFQLRLICSKYIFQAETFSEPKSSLNALSIISQNTYFSRVCEGK